ncbi:MAG: zinc ribbon domain-containing protein [Enterovibrio sp.]
MWLEYRGLYRFSLFRCHCCGYKMDEMPLSVRKWDCPSCAAMDIDRDLNATLNIRDKGFLELKAAGWSSLPMEAA